MSYEPDVNEVCSHREDMREKSKRMEAKYGEEATPVPVSAKHEDFYIAIEYSNGKLKCNFNIEEAIEELKKHGLEMRGKHSHPIKE